VKGVVLLLLPAYASIDEIVSTITVIGTAIVSIYEAIKRRKWCVTHDSHDLPDRSMVTVDFSSVHTEYS